MENRRARGAFPKTVGDEEATVETIDARLRQVSLALAP